MSFANQVREELLGVEVKKNCCRRALVLGLLLSAVMGEDKEARITYRQEPVAACAKELIGAVYAKEPTASTHGACGHRYWTLSFRAPSHVKLYYAMRAADADPAAFLKLDCPSCRSAFLRGLFLAAGTVSDPHKQFHLELLLPEDIAPFAEQMLGALGYPPRVIKRSRGMGLYYKDSNTQEELLTLMGAQHVVFEVINSRIERDIRNQENRVTNCVTKNIEKTISAASRQMDAINGLMEGGRLERLPEQLRITALLRYRNPDATLDELAGLHEPPISKSGLNHRLQRILEEAAEWEHKRKETT